MKNYDLIVFDWDGTIIDSTGAIALAIQLAAMDIGYPPPSTAQAKHVIGLGLQDALRHAMPDLPPEKYRLLGERYRHHYLAKDSSLFLYEGIEELLKNLHQQGALLAVATGKTRVGLDRSLKTHPIGPLFSATRCADETSSKPHPLMLHELMDELGVSAPRTLMIGDTTHDSQMAKNAGVGAVSVAYGAHEVDHLASLEPLAIVHSVAELSSWLYKHA